MIEWDPRTMTDETLVEADEAHADDAFRELFRRYHRPLYAFARTRAGTREHAEDVVQEAFARLWRCRRSFDPERGRVAALLFTMARNLIIDGQRRRARGCSMPMVAESADTATTPEIDVATGMMVTAALGRLRAGHRDVLALAFWGDLSQGQMADVLRVPVGTVKSRTFHALRAMRAELQLLGAG